MTTALPPVDAFFAQGKLYQLLVFSFIFWPNLVEFLTPLKRNDLNDGLRIQLNLKIKLATLTLAVSQAASSLHAQLTIPNADGSDGALNVTVSTNIDLSLAANGSWTNPSQIVGAGTYDTNQWAVVFKYTSVNIASGATVTFANHITHAPVIWLVSGNVSINGTVSLDGQASSSYQNNLPEPGPGGFRGGGPVSVYGTGYGFGPGGGTGGYSPPSYSPVQPVIGSPRLRGHLTGV